MKENSSILADTFEVVSSAIQQVDNTISYIA